MLKLIIYISFFFFNDTATTEIYTLSLHDALPICAHGAGHVPGHQVSSAGRAGGVPRVECARGAGKVVEVLLERSEEHTSELQSRQYLVCRLLLEKKKKHIAVFTCIIHSE